MNKFVAMAMAALIAATPLGAAAQSTGQGIKEDAREAKREIKSDAREAKQEIKNDAREVKRSIKRSAKKVKRKVAVARCNDGRYSYTHHKTCSNHGGIRERLR